MHTRTFLEVLTVSGTIGHLANEDLVLVVDQSLRTTQTQSTWASLSQFGRARSPELQLQSHNTAFDFSSRTMREYYLQVFSYKGTNRTRTRKHTENHFYMHMDTLRLRVPEAEAEEGTLRLLVRY